MIESYEFSKKNTFNLRHKLILLNHCLLFNFITAIIVIVYAISLAVKTHMTGTDSLWFFDIFEHIVISYFVIEICLKIYAEKEVCNFFHDKWNVFDFIIVLISVLPFNSFEYIAIARILRVFRILNVISHNDNIKKLLIALEGAIPSVLNIILLMSIVFYVYAILGCNLFGSLESGLWVNFSVSMLTLFRILTFEDWTDVMYEAMEIYPYAWVYFISFIIINGFVIFNLFIAVIVSETSKIQDSDISYMLDNEGASSPLTHQELSTIKDLIKKIK